MLKVVSHSEAETEALGAALASLLRPGDFVALSGGLGAGKTALCRGLVRALGSEECASPTFTIVHEYDCDPPVYHFDAYRLNNADELYEIGCEEYFARGGIVLMEWPEKVEEALPKEAVRLFFAGVGEGERLIEIDGLGPAREEALKAAGVC